MESALSPNTAAFLDYLSSQLNGDGTNDPQMGSIDSTLGNQMQNNATSLPPSAFFQLPDIKPVLPNQSTSSSLSPPTKSDKSAGRSVSVSGSEGDSPVVPGTGADKGGHAGLGPDGLHKRKAGISHAVEEEDEDEDSDSDAPAGHDGKRQHQNDKPTKKGGRKSFAGDEERPGKEMSKAARRKEQNRAAQKAFRERREARVTDLEAKVAELENKSFSSTVENENLRSILKRLQEENVRLKQSAFTFAMPRAGSTSNSSPTEVRVPSPGLQSVSKPPTPPHSIDEPLKSVHDVSRPPPRSSSSNVSGGMAPSPESLQSVGSSNSSRNMFNGNSPMRFDSFSNFSSTDTGITPPSVSSDNKSDFDALWASFYPPGQQQPGQLPAYNNATVNNNASNTSLPNNSGFTQQQYQAALASPNPLSQFLANQMAQGKFQPQDIQPLQNQMQNQNQTQTQSQTQPNMAYRDPSADALGQDWSTNNNTSIDDFLASLKGKNTSGDDNPVTSADDDLFNQQLQAMLAGNNFDAQFGNTTFSPTNYLNMSPSPLNSLSNSASPQSAQVSGASYSASPESSNASSAPPKELPAQYTGCQPGQVVNVVDANGNIVKPSDLWVKMGMQHQDNVDNLLIDDLCDQMRAKAKCHDGAPQLHISDVEHMMKWEKGLPPKPVVEPVGKNWGAVFNYKHQQK